MTRTDVTELERSRIRKYFFGRESKPTHEKIIKWYKKTHKREFSRSTISKSLSPRYAYLDNPKVVMKDSRVRTSQWPLLEQTFKVWVLAVEENGGGLTDDNIIGKAREIWEEVKEPGQQEPQFSHGWLDRLKQRLGLKARAVMGEAASVPSEAYEEMKLGREICSSDIDEFIESSEDLKCNRESEKAQSFHEANTAANEFIKGMEEKQTRIISDGEADAEAPSDTMSGWIEQLDGMSEQNSQISLTDSIIKSISTLKGLLMRLRDESSSITSNN